MIIDTIFRNSYIEPKYHIAQNDNCFNQIFHELNSTHHKSNMGNITLWPLCARLLYLL